MAELEGVIKDSKVSLCYSCGRCTPACPLSTYENYSPRIFVERLLTMNELDKVNLWECLTCKGCTMFCPSSIDFPEFVRSLRSIFKTEADEQCAHAGILQSLMRLMAYGDFKQNRLEWITPDLKVSKEGDTLLFVGCSPYYDVYFDKWKPLEITRSAVKLLNHIGIEPVVLEDEVCCGHDLLWSGDEEAYQKLAEKNKKLIEKANIKRIVFTCPECYSAFKNEYKLGDNIELMHLTELLNDNLDKLDFKESDVKVSYHDSCRMGRFLGVYEPPRKLLEAIPGLELNELPHSKSRSICCGTSNWMSCDWKSKTAQLALLQDAKGISEKLVTSCPKCRIHFNCTMDEKEKNPIVEVEDIIVTLANSAIPKSGSNTNEKRED